MNTPPPLPPDAGGRIDLLDIVRGFALPGIALMNVEWFSRPIVELSHGLPPGLGGIDHAAAWAILVFVQGKFWLLFALLFGAGFAVMQSRAQAAGKPFLAAYVRRLALLFVLGIAHALLLWVGDILHSYAIAALALLLLQRVEPLGRGIAGLMLYGLMTAMIAGGAVWYLVHPDVGAGPPAIDAADLAASAQSAAVYATGDFAAVTAQRAKEFAELVAHGEFFLVLVAAGVFLVGSWLLGAGPLSRPAAHRRFHRVAVFALFPLGLAATVWAATLATGSGSPPTDDEMLAQFLSWIGAPLMSLGYVGALALASLRPAPGAWLRDWLAPSGRMALTNYLMTSLILSTLFFGYGFGLYGQVSRAGQVGIVAAITVFQVVASRWWLARHRYGPLEWAWRAFTWWRWPPLRRAPVGDAALP